MSPNFWEDKDRASKINQKLNYLREKIDKIKQVEKLLEDGETLIDLLAEATDFELRQELKEKMLDLGSKIEALEIETLFTDPYDSHNAILTLHPGAGGTESQDWVEMLYRMYARFGERKDYKIDILDYLAGDEAGIKSVTIELAGPFAYGNLKSEKGVHRLVRISPFDTNSKRHTSFASVEVLPQLEDESLIEIKEEDLKIDTYRAGGAGGQHVNKTDTAVRLTHIPSGIVVQCQSERSQLNNKNAALKILKGKLLIKKREEEEEKLRLLRGEQKEIGWGSQIRSYVFQPYQLVKDHRTGVEKGQVDKVLDGEIDDFIQGYLRKNKQKDGF